MEKPSISIPVPDVKYQPNAQEVAFLLSVADGDFQAEVINTLALIFSAWGDRRGDVQLLHIANRLDELGSEWVLSLAEFIFPNGSTP
jgi:hypothetical protein